MKNKDSYWHSKISTFQSCPKKYEFQYILEEPAPQYPLSAAISYGKAIHTGLEAMLRGAPVEEAIDTFELFWQTLKDEKMTYDRHGWEALKEMGAVHLSKFSRFQLKHITNIKVLEERLYSTIGEYKIEGTADCVAEYKGVMSVIDFKTAGYRYDKRKAYNAYQLLGYDLLSGKIAKQVIYIVFVKQTGGIQVLHAPITEEMRHDYVQNTLCQLKAITQSTCYPKNPNSCVYGRHLCPYFEKCFKGPPKKSVDNKE